MTLAATLLTALAASMLQTTAPPEPPRPPEPAVAPAAEDEEGDVTAVVVQGVRPRGSVSVDVEPEITLGQDDIKALGVNSLGELVEQLGALTDTGGGGGAQIVLINGRRATGEQEWRSIPTDAIERSEVLPEQVALAYGYPVDRKVLNVVLKQAFQQASARAEGTTPTQGGAERGKAGGNYFTIRKGDRWTLDLEYERNNALFETERDIVRDPGSRPYDLTGNVTGLPFGSEIDPALSGLAGQTVLVAPVLRGATTPGLADFVAGAGVARTDDLTARRSRVPDVDGGKIDLSVAHDLDGKTQATLSATLQDRSTQSYLGLPGIGLILPSANPYSPFANDVQLFRFVDAPQSMIQTSDVLTAKAGLLVDGYLLGDWRWTLSGDYNRVQSDTRTGRGLSAAAFQSQLNAGAPGANPFGDLTAAGLTRLPTDTASSVNTTGSAELLITGDLPEIAGLGLYSTFTLGWDTRALESESVRAGLRLDRSLSRDRYYGKLDISGPLITRGVGPLGGLGAVYAGVEAEYAEASDFGGLLSYSGNANWSPLDGLNLTAWYDLEQQAPDIGQLNDPIISTPNLPVFDFATGQTVLVTYVTGGNPDLEASSRQRGRFSIGLRPFKERQLRLSATYVWTRTDDELSTFPAITPQLEAALPGRFTRDGSGQLIALDARALNYSRSEKRSLQLNFFYTFPFGKPAALGGGGRGGPGRPGGPGGRPGGGPGGPGGGPRFPGGPVMITGPGGGPGGPGGGAVFVGGGGPGGRGGFGQPGQGRVILGLNYLHRIQDEIEVRPGLPVIDQLESGRAPRDQVDGSVRVGKGGHSASVGFVWRGESQIIGGAGGTDLTFRPMTTVNLDFSADLGNLPGLTNTAPWLKGTYLTLSLNNLFDERQDVISSTGSRPLTYQPDYLDPYGRTITLRIRKTLF